MRYLPHFAGFLIVASMAVVQPISGMGILAQGAKKKAKPGALAFAGERPQGLRQGGGLEATAEPGRSASDTLRRLKEIDSEPVPPGGVPQPGRKGVTIGPPGSWTAPPGSQGFNITLSPAETGVVVNGVPKSEQFALMVPAGYNPSTPPPLVVAWHGYGSSHNQPMPWLVAEANARGWALMAPLGIADNTFSWLPGQQAVEKSLDWLRTNYPFDETRVYGVGFSMGAMCITNYAARHLAPADVRFAALATVCGTFDNVDNYTQTPGVHALMDSLFGGSPYTPPVDFEYWRTSLLRLSMPVVSPFPPVEGITLARTISKIPVYMTWSTDDNVVSYSPEHNTSLSTYLTSLGNTPTQFPQTGLALKHHWSVLNVINCFNFFATKTLVANPTNFSVLADRDGSFYSLTTTGGPPPQFRRVDVAVDNAIHTVDVTQTFSVTNINVNLSGFGFSANTDIAVNTGTTDATSDALTLSGLPTAAPPSKIRRAGLDVYDWNWNGSTSIQVSAPAGLSSGNIYYNTFDLAFSVTGTPAIGNNISLNQSGGTAGESYWVLYCDSPGFLPLSLAGDNDPRWLLQDPATTNILHQGTLDGAGSDAVRVTVPNDTNLTGLTFPLQTVTAPGVVSGIPFFFGRISNKIDLLIQ